jgi:acyl-CoA dehydrogenase
MDRAGNKAARNEIAVINVQAPTMALRIIDDATQAQAFAVTPRWRTNGRPYGTLRFADGPDEIHARAEFGRYA